MNKFIIYLVRKIVNLCSILALIAACQPRGAHVNSGQINNDKLPPSLPVSELHSISRQAYETHPGFVKECLGRLEFELQEPVEWPLHYRGDNGVIFYGSFTNEIFDPGDSMRFGNVSVSVIDLKGVEARWNPLGSTPARRMESLIKALRKDEAALNKITKRSVRSTFQKSKQEDLEWSVNEIKGNILNLSKEFKEIKLNVSESEGYSSGEPFSSSSAEDYSIFWAYLKRQDRLYVFKSFMLMTSAQSTELHKVEFEALLNRFRLRSSGEIPSEPGICIPFGFIPDDGRTPIDIKQSIRFPDAPSVLYTIETGTVTERHIKTPVITAIGNAIISVPNELHQGADKYEVTRRIGPLTYPIGNLKATQGGVVIRTVPENGPAFDVYTVYTGYAGWKGSAVLPYISVHMRAISKEKVPQLKNNPPPFEQSMARLNLLLRTMHLRPTNPLMPELIKQ